ncbi:hypothetical protein GCM10007864_17040 [Sinorhizobium fredii]|nr:hypothetical protein GCM10007864_17040 [Sinorhizobium fredii]
MDFIENDELVHVLLEVELRFAELGAISIGLKIEVDRGTPLSDSECKSRFPHLSRADKRDGGVCIDKFYQRGGYMAVNHPCIYGI